MHVIMMLLLHFRLHRRACAAPGTAEGYFRCVLVGRSVPPLQSENMTLIRKKDWTLIHGASARNANTRNTNRRLMVIVRRLENVRLSNMEETRFHKKEIRFQTLYDSCVWPEQAETVGFPLGSKWTLETPWSRA